MHGDACLPSCALQLPAWWTPVAEHAPRLAWQIVGGRIVAHAVGRILGNAAAWTLHEVLCRRCGLNA